MKHNDISNREAPIIVFNIDNVLFLKEQKETGLIAKAKLFFKSEEEKLKHEYFNRGVNVLNRYKIENLWHRFDYSVYFMTKMPFVREIEEFLSELNLPYTRIFQFPSLDEFRLMCDNRFMYFFDDDDSFISMVSRNNALNIDKMEMIMKGR